MSKYGYTPSYFGFVGDDGKLKGATMMLAKNVLGTYKYGYCPRGFLLDYDNKDDGILDLNNMDITDDSSNPEETPGFIELI